MTFRDDARAAIAAAHRFSWRGAVALVASWVALAVAAKVSLPLQYPYQALDEMISTGIVVGLILPISVSVIVLDEGPAHLVAGAARRLIWSRALSAGAYAVVTLLGAVSAASAVNVDFDLLVGDAMFLSATALIGVSALGLRLGWILPTAVALVASAPGLIPWQANLLYRHGYADHLAPVTVGLLAVGAVGHLCVGSGGLGAQRMLRSSAQALTD
jgi:hypothetical protein